MSKGSKTKRPILPKVIGHTIQKYYRGSINLIKMQRPTYRLNLTTAFPKI